MLSIAHATTGAFIASVLPNPVLYIPLALTAHYIEDYIVHWDVGTGLSKGTRKRTHAFYLELVDLALAGLLILFLFPPLGGISSLFSMSGFFSYTFSHPIIGAFFCLLPDFLEAPKNFLRWEPTFLKPVNAFHHAVHRSTPNIAQGLLPQLFLILLLWGMQSFRGVIQ